MNKLLTENQHKLIGELCDYVEASVLPENFEMRSYRSRTAVSDPPRFQAVWNVDSSGSAGLIQELVKENPDTNLCGTSGCMIGYAPMCHPELHKDSSNWYDVSTKYSNPSYGINSFMFGGSWRGFQNTPEGSVERIRLALEFDGQLAEYQWEDVEGDTVEELRASIHEVKQRNLGTDYE
jgi:hypothetical protein